MLELTMRQVQIKIVKIVFLFIYIILSDQIIKILLHVVHTEVKYIRVSLKKIGNEFKMNDLHSDPPNIL